MIIPRELQPISISYNNYDVNIETIQDDNGSDREIPRLTEVNKTEDISTLIIPEGYDEEDAPNVDVQMAIPQGKAITMKIKAKAKMLTETKK